MRDELGKKGNHSFGMELDETDRAIMQALSDELSEITVSEELIAAALWAAEKRNARRTSGETVWDEKETKVKETGWHTVPGQKVTAEEQDKMMEWKKMEEKETKEGAEQQKVQERRAVAPARWKRPRSHFAGRALTAAAALLLIILGVSGFGRNLKAVWDGAGNESSGGMDALREPAQNGASQESRNPVFEGEGNDIDVPEEVPGNAFTDNIFSLGDGDGSSCSGGEPYAADQDEGMDGIGGNFQLEEMEDWLYRELLAVFDGAKMDAELKEEASGSSMEEPEKVPKDTGSAQDFLKPGEVFQEPSDKAGSRSITWQRDGKVLSCVIYAQDYRVEATLQEGGAMRQIVLADWVYAEELWELAADS